MRASRVMGPAVVVLAFFAGRAAHANPEQAVPSAAMSSESAPHGGDPRALAQDAIVSSRTESVATATLTFVTAKGGLTPDDAVEFTDVALFGLDGRLAIAKRAEVFLGVDFLPKQPSFTDELVWQGADLGARVQFWERYALWLHGAGGPLLEDSGFWGAIDGGVEGRKSLDQVIVLHGALGGDYTRLWPDAGGEVPWIAEASVDGSLVFRAPHGEVAAWIGTGFFFPVASAGPIDPQTRVNFQIGTVLSYIPHWDLFFQVAWLDRGDLENPDTTLPILVGGFDQSHLIFGLAHRFEDEDPPAYVMQ